LNRDDQPTTALYLQTGFLLLAKAGMTEDEIARVLWDEAAHGRSPDKRRRQIPSIISSLWDYGHLSSGLEEAA
jgi:hypothetical protein